MATTLYLLRQPLDQISSSVFHPNDEGMEIVYVEQAATVSPASHNGWLVTGNGMPMSSSHPTLTYDDLVEKIFSSEHVIVV